MRQILTVVVVSVIAGGVAGVSVAAATGANKWSASSWSALAAWVTAGIALTAGLVAWSQLRETRRSSITPAKGDALGVSTRQGRYSTTAQAQALEGLGVPSVARTDPVNGLPVLTHVHDAVE